MSDKVIPFPGKLRDGLVLNARIERSEASLLIYGEELEPEAITKLLGVQPSSTHCKGDQLHHSGPPLERGVWIHDVEGFAPTEPETLMIELLSKLPEDQELWRQLTEEFDVRLCFVLWLGHWNSAFTISPELVSRIARLNVEITIDIYDDRDDE